MKDLKIGCGKPTGSKIGEPEKGKKPMEEPESIKEGVKNRVFVQNKAKGSRKNKFTVIF